MALSIAGRSEAPGLDGRGLARRFSERHPGYTRSATGDELTRALRPEVPPATCRHVAEALGAWEKHCSSCPSHGRIEGPIDLGRRKPRPAPDRPSPLQREARPETHAVGARPASPSGSQPTTGDAGVVPTPAGAWIAEQLHPLQLEVVLRVPHCPPRAVGELLRAARACLELPGPGAGPSAAG